MDEFKMNVNGMLPDEDDLHKLVSSFYALVGVAFSPSESMTSEIKGGAEKAAGLIMNKILEKLNSTQGE